MVSYIMGGCSLTGGRRKVLKSRRVAKRSVAKSGKSLYNKNSVLGQLTRGINSKGNSVINYTLNTAKTLRKKTLGFR